MLPESSIQSQLTASCPKVTVAICTRNRPQSLHRAVESVFNSCFSGHVLIEILIVDDGDLDEEYILELKRQTEIKEWAFYYYRKPESLAGLLHSRVESVKRARGEIVLFIDDDVQLGMNYIQVMLDTYKDDSIVGVGGPDPNEEGQKWYARIAYHFFLLASRSPGKFSISGTGDSMRLWRRQTNPFRTEHVKGCNMSFRRTILQDLQCPDVFRGYSFGEDMYISRLASRKGILMANPNLKILHYEDLSSRDDEQAVARARVVNFFHILLMDGKSVLGSLAFIWSILGLILLAIVRGRWRTARGYVCGLFDLCTSRWVI